MIEIITPAESKRLTTLDAVKADLGITGTASDEALGALIDQFSDTIAAWCGRTFGGETVRETRDVRARDDRHEMLLGRWPIASVDSITVTGIALAPGDYVLDPAKGELLYRGTATRFALWPVGESIIEYGTGYALPGEAERTLPHDIERACIIMIRSAWHGMRRDPALRSEEHAGVATFTYFAANGDALSIEAQALLSPYRLLSVG